MATAMRNMDAWAAVLEGSHDANEGKSSDARDLLFQPAGEESEDAGEGDVVPAAVAAFDAAAPPDDAAAADDDVITFEPARRSQKWIPGAPFCTLKT